MGRATLHGSARSPVFTSRSAREVAGVRHLVWPTAVRVCERGRVYEDEGSVRQARGAVAVDPDAWWSAALSAAIARGGDAPAVAALRLERHGPAVPGCATASQVDLSIPCAELDALVVLLAGLVAQARRDGVIPLSPTR